MDEEEDAQEEEDFDQQLFSIGIIALVALVGVIVVFAIGVSTITNASAKFQRAVNQDILLIQQVMPPAFTAANRILNGVESFATQTFNAATYGIVEGAQAVINVILSIGQSALETIQTGFKTLLDQLGEIGTTSMQFFENMFAPVVSLAQEALQVMTYFLEFVYTLFSPILVSLAAIFRAIARIGSIF